MQPKLKIEYVPTETLAPYANNAKQHGDADVAAIAESIEQFGFDDPIGVWTNPEGVTEIVEGHGRLMAAKKLGMERVPIIKLDHLDDDARRAYVHVHNQTTLNTGFDIDMLNAEMQELSDFDWGAFGFDAKEQFELIDLDSIIEDDVPVDAEPRVKRGEIWILGQHRLMCGDSTKQEDVQKLMGGNQAQLLLTDPPYNVGLGMDGDQAIDPIEAKKLHRRTDGLTIANDYFEKESEFEDWLSSVWDATKPSLMSGCPFYIWHASTNTPTFRKSCERNGMKTRQILVWVKSVFALGRQDYQWQHEPCIYGWTDGAAHYFAPIRNEPTVIDDAMDTKKMTKTELREALENILQNGIETTVLRYAKPVASSFHPTTKPVKLFARLISNSSREGDTVLDVFGGSGTTMIACEQLNRKSYLMELDPHYCDVIVKRWESFTGKEAVLANG